MPRRPIREGLFWDGDLWLSDEGVDALQVGMEALNLLRSYEPEFWAAHVADRIVSPPLMLGAAAALFQLQEHRGLALRWPGWNGDLECVLETTPAETLVAFDGVSIEFLSEMDFYIFAARPESYGIGVQLYMDEGYTMHDPLTLALWWLAQGTEYDTGLDMTVALDDARLGRGLESAIRELHPLPRMDDRVCRLAAAAIPEAADLAVPADLIRYAFGQTSNSLANVNLTEELNIHGYDEEEWSWDDRDRLVPMSMEAQRIQDAYAAWGGRVQAEGAAGIDAVGQVLHRAARTVRRAERARERAGPQTLIEIFAPILQEEPA